MPHWFPPKILSSLIRLVRVVRQPKKQTDPLLANSIRSQEAASCKSQFLNTLQYPHFPNVKQSLAHLIKALTACHERLLGLGKESRMSMT